MREPKELFEQHSVSGCHTFNWTDHPFAVTVKCTKIPHGFVTDWWVSGRKWQDDKPSLMIRFRHGIESNKTDLQGNLKGIWERIVREFAFETALVGGINNDSNEVSGLDQSQRAKLIWFHLFANDHLGHFNLEGNSKIERTVNMHILLKSFGYKQPQKFIAEYETSIFLQEVKPTAINRRLAIAKEQGLL
jgi:hypothetical protein